jgi:hypothetical protein
LPYVVASAAFVLVPGLVVAGFARDLPAWSGPAVSGAVLVAGGAGAIVGFFGGYLLLIAVQGSGSFGGSGTGTAGVFVATGLGAAVGAGVGAVTTTTIAAFSE